MVRFPKRTAPLREGGRVWNREPNLSGLPVFYFDRIRVGRLHLHLHLRHEGSVPEPRRKRHTDSLYHGRTPVHRGRQHRTGSKGPSSSRRSRSFLVCRLEAAKPRLLRTICRRRYSVLILRTISIPVGQKNLVLLFRVVTSPLSTFQLLGRHIPRYLR